MSRLRFFSLELISAPIAFAATPSIFQLRVVGFITSLCRKKKAGESRVMNLVEMITRSPKRAKKASKVLSGTGYAQIEGVLH